MRNWNLIGRRDAIRAFLHRMPSLHWLLNDIRCWLATVVSPPVATKVPNRSDARRFMFVVGAGRSGNTLFRRLLMENYSIYFPPETYVLPRVADYRIRGRGLTWNGFVDLIVASFEYHPEFETFEIQSLRDFAVEAHAYPPERQTVTDILHGLYAHFSKNAGIPCDWLGDKTPLNTLHLGQIDRVMPGGSYIYLLRDGVDVAVSYVHAGIYSSIEGAAERWVHSQRSWEAFRNRIPETRRMEVRYEDMVAAPEETIRSVASYFGIVEREAVADVKAVLGDVAKRSHHGNVTKEPTTDSVGKGRNTLSERDKKRLRPILSGWLEHCGYQRI